MPRVSVVIPHFNRAHLVVSAIKSVLAQTFRDFELIIVDDGSTVDIERVLSSLDLPQIRLVAHKKNEGAASARNTGIALAHGEYIAFLDSDDIWHPRKLERQLKYMIESEPRVLAACTGFLLFSSHHPQGEERGTTAGEHHGFLRGCRVSPGSTLMAHRTVFEKVGSFDASLRRLEDWDWLLRLGEHSNFAVVPEVLAEVNCSEIGNEHCDDVVAAVMRMKTKAYPALRGGKNARRQLFGALENELAAYAYKSRRYDRASIHFMKSLWYFPWRNRDTVRRLSKVVWRDLTAKGGAGEHSRAFLPSVWSRSQRR